MVQDLSISVDTSEFKKVFKNYLKYSKRDLVENINTHAYFIARNAVSTTPASSKERIIKDLGDSSAKYPGVPLSAIMVNVTRGRKGLKGLTGEKMAAAMQRFVNKRMTYVNYFRAGWLAAMKAIQPFTSKRGGTHIPAGVKARTAGLGGAAKAVDSSFNWTPFAAIWNDVKVHNEAGKRKIEIGAQKAINMEIQSMKDYVTKKQTELCNTYWNR